MEQFSYTRPREKIQLRGVSALSDAELLQVIIGSGVKGHSVARITKAILKLRTVKEGALSYEDLLAVDGVGAAKASQIVAAFELGRREVPQHSTVEIRSDQQESYAKAKRSTRRCIVYQTQDGAGKSISEHLDFIASSKNVRSTLRKMFSFAMHDKADGLVIAIGMRTENIDTPNGEVLEIIKNIYETADLLELRIGELRLVNATMQRIITRKVLV